MENKGNKKFIPDPKTETDGSGRTGTLISKPAPAEKRAHSVRAG